MKTSKYAFLFIGALTFSSAWAGWGDMLQKSAEQYLSGESNDTNTTATQQSAKTPSSGTSAALATLSTSEIDAGLKEALAIGAERAIAFLGKPGGFLDNPKVRIPLPGPLEKVGSALRAAGQGKYVDEFETTVNRAAEQAIPQTLDIVKETVSNMTLDDVRGILAGSDDAATQYLRNNAWDAMFKAVKPIVAQATEKTGATAAYKTLMAQGGSQMSALSGLLGGSSTTLDLDEYVTEKALDGLFAMLAEEEKKIRQNPMARTTDLLKQVFGK